MTFKYSTIQFKKPLYIIQNYQILYLNLPLESYIMEDIIGNYNKQSIAYIKSHNFQQAFQVLMKCLKLLENLKDTLTGYRLLSMTYSNFSALYKESGKLNESNKFLTKVIEVEKKFQGNKQNTINAYLSLCANHSIAGNHEIALRNGLTSMMLLQKELPIPDNNVSVLVITYHNVGVEYEYLGRVQEAVDCYYKGWSLAKSRLGLTHSLTLSIKNSFLASTNSNSSRLPEVNMRMSSQHAYKRSDLAESIHTGSTSSSGATDTRNIVTPRYNQRSRKRNPDGRQIDRVKLKIDLLTQRINERNAAVLIQAWWKGVLQRRKFVISKRKFELKKAAIKAKVAYSEFKSLKERYSLKTPNINQKNSKPQKKITPQFKFKSRSQDPPQIKALAPAPNQAEKIFQFKSTNNQIRDLKSRTRKKCPLSLQQLHKLHLPQIITLQSFIKMIITRAKYEKVRSAIIIIQKNFRMYLCYKLYKSISTSMKKIKNDFSLYRQRFFKT